jgi:hypothetical protein
MRSSPADDSPRLRLGTALKCRQEPYHRCVIVSEPEENGGYIVLLRLTSATGKWRDRDCILTPQDWSELDHDSSVAYSTALCGRAEAELIQAIARGEFEVISAPPFDTLRRIIAAGRTAEGMPPKAQAFLAQI